MPCAKLICLKYAGKGNDRMLEYIAKVDADGELILVQSESYLVGSFEACVLVPKQTSDKPSGI